MTEDFQREALAVIKADTHSARPRTVEEVFAATSTSLSSVYPKPQRVEVDADGQIQGCVRVRVCGPEIIGEFTVGLRRYALG